jgi:hypothetical protein
VCGCTSTFDDSFGIGGRSSVDLFRPNERAESLGTIVLAVTVGRGTGAFWGGWVVWSSVDNLRGGSRGGNEGTEGNDGDVEGRIFWVRIFGVDFVGFNGSRVLSLFSLLGGRGGSATSPHAGAIIRDLASIDGDLDEIGVLVVPIDNPDMLDMAELVESAESRLGGDG